MSSFYQPYYSLYKGKRKKEMINLLIEVALVIAAAAVFTLGMKAIVYTTVLEITEPDTKETYLKVSRLIFKAMVFFAVALALVIQSVKLAKAEFVPGNVFIESCNNPAPDRQAACVGYLAGVTDSYLRSGQFCLPPNISPKQISDFTKYYINTTASIRNQSALMMVLYALKARWPCRGVGPNVALQFNFRGF